MAKKDSLKEFDQAWLLEPFLELPNFFYKKMFGGLAAYFEGKLVVVLTEDLDTKWRGRKYKSPPWNGILIPTSRECHASLIRDLPGLIQHPVLGKWLYLPLGTERYELNSAELFKLIRRRDQRLGVLPSPRAHRTKSKKKSSSKEGRRK